MWLQKSYKKQQAVPMYSLHNKTSYGSVLILP